MMLINRLEPYHLESLSGYMDRLRKANYYEEPRWYLDLVPSQSMEQLDYLSDPQSYEAISAITELSVAQIYSMTVHRFSEPYGYQYGKAMLLDRERRFWKWSGLSTFVHGNQTRKVCPLCWRKYGTYFIPWSARQVTTCFMHQVLLIDTCSMCRSPLQISQLEGACKTCKTKLDELVTLSTRNHEASFRLQVLIWSALGFISSHHAYGISSEHILRTIPASQAIVFLWSGYQMLRAYDEKNPLFNRSQLLPGTDWKTPPRDIRIASITDIHGALVAMSQLLYGWPQSWYETLEHILKVGHISSMQPFPAALAGRFESRSWAWLHKSWTDFVSEHMYHNPAIVPWLRYYREIERTIHINNPTLLSQKEAARLLEVGEAQVKHFVESGILVATAKSERPLRRIWRLVDADSVEELRTQRSQYLTLEQVAELIDLSKRQVVALVAAGMLEAEHGPLVDGQTVWKFIGAKVEAALERLIGHIPVEVPQPGRNPHEIADFRRGQQTITRVYGVGLPRFILDIQQGVLPALRATSELRFDVLWFNQKVFVDYHKHYRRVKPGELSVAAVCERLNCKPYTLRQLYRAGLLVPITDRTDNTTVRHLYAEKDVAAFVERYIDSQQAAELLHITRITVQIWVRDGWLTALTGPAIDGSHSYRFDREALLQWRDERLTFGEAMELLGVSKATLHRWVVSGKLKPIEDIGGKQRWFWRSDVLLLLQSSS